MRAVDVFLAFPVTGYRDHRGTGPVLVNVMLALGCGIDHAPGGMRQVLVFGERTCTGGGRSALATPIIVRHSPNALPPIIVLATLNGHGDHRRGGVVLPRLACAPTM
jgi:hypothetical protein